ncbi:AsnC family transcriptional regulator [Yinghuangia sp. ASG 101]|uniref:Lrp/AsnC family transcriptional regulator n=1 Tax=Yinghuangia sp. ASG 101 TaxID=2896848 RepID=UPI001E3E365A|nr:AsnC family transcriptional regulator [Yinghuangia sp. ASG 101]UGQ12184.1 AsnC family transcriptional regulator [Yinghuangia sp. ASG 101]
MDSVIFDDLDRGLVHALEIDGRAPFSRIAEVLGVSESTVARRYRRLRAHGQCRVVGVRDVRRTGQPTWVLRARCSPAATDAIGFALADAPEAAWVQGCSAGTEVWCSVRADPADEHNLALTRRLGRTPGVLAVTAVRVLRVVVGGPQSFSFTSKLSAAQQNALASAAPAVSWDGPPPEPSTLDAPLLRALSVDGRASYADLARTCRVSEAAVRRRLDVLRRAGVVFFEQETDLTALGHGTTALLWMTVRPSRVAAVSDAVASHPAVAFAAVTTGAVNLSAYVACRDVGELYGVVVDGFGALDGVEHIDTAPVAVTYKREGTVARGRRRG